jgi:hypothetical protein
MAAKLESDKEFGQSLAEVDLLLGESDGASPGKPLANSQKCAVMNKAAVLLLMGKFEAFLENAAEEFLFAINSLGAKGQYLPRWLLIEHTVQAMKGVETKLSDERLEEVQALFVTISRQWTDLEACTGLWLAPLNLFHFL